MGVTPLEMAFAYSTLANSGKRVCAEWASYKCGPVAIKGVDGEDKPERETEEVFSQEVADTAKTMLSYVISSGTGTQAQVGEFAAGKTGTTENYGDAWFCGFIDKYTTCVWMGYPDKVQPMETEYGGSPVAGGTWPAVIWQSFMSQAISIRDKREAEQAAEDAEDDRHRSGARPGHARRRRPHRRTTPLPRLSPSRTPPRLSRRPSPSRRPRSHRPSSRRRRSPHRRRSSHRRRAVAPSRAPRATSRQARRRACPGGHGRDTHALAASQKRHGSSTALLIPIRVPTTISGSAVRGRISIGPSTSGVPFRSSQIPSACVSLPGPLHRSSTRSSPRRSRIRSTPSTGSSARISAAAPVPSSSATALRSAWIPYER